MHIELLSIEHVTLELISSINEAYETGEAGIIELPFQRVSRDELVQWVTEEGVLGLWHTSDMLVGVIRVQVEGKTATWGGLAVDRRFQGQGYGSKLVRAAETYVMLQHKCKLIQLELLVPVDASSAHKEGLRQWYTKLGYQPVWPATVLLNKGSKLAGRFVMETDAALTTYCKRL